MKRADILLGTAVLFLCALWLGIRFFARSDGASVVVRKDGEICGTYALGTDQEVDIGTGNHIVIEDGSVRMTWADCPDHICVRQGRISAPGAVITCLPNRVTVQVSGDAVPDGDAQPDLIVD